MSLKILLLLSTIIIPVTLGSILYSKLPQFGRYIVLFFYANLLSDGISLLFSKLYGNNLIVYYFFVSASALLLGAAYSKLLANKKLFTFSFCIPILAALEGVIFGTDTFNSYSFTVFNLSIIPLTLYTYHKMLLFEIDEDIFFFNGFLFFYCFSSAIFFFVGKFLQQSDVTLMMQLFTIHSYINSITNLLFAFSIWTLFKSYSSVR